MNETQVCILGQVRQVLDGTEALRFQRSEGDAGRYQAAENRRSERELCIVNTLRITDSARPVRALGPGNRRGRVQTARFRGLSEDLHPELEKWPRLFEQVFPIYKWIPGGLGRCGVVHGGGRRLRRTTDAVGNSGRTGSFYAAS